MQGLKSAILAIFQNALLDVSAALKNPSQESNFLFWVLINP